MTRRNARTRRSAAAATVLATILPLAGCGFHPLYAKPEPGSLAANEQAALNDKLARVFVDPIMERSGQQLRQALQARLGGDGDSQNQTYRLVVTAAIVPEFLGVHPDNSPSRVRISGDARWSLTKVALPPVMVANGHARALDGYNIINEQYFASTLAGETVNGRVAQQLADRIVQQLAIWFRQHPDGMPVTAVAAPKTPEPRRAPGFLNYQPVPGDDGSNSTQPVGADGMPAGALGLQAPIGTR